MALILIGTILVPIYEKEITKAIDKFFCWLFRIRNDDDFRNMFNNLR